MSGYDLPPHSFVVIVIHPPHLAAGHPAHEHSLAPVGRSHDVAKARKVSFGGSWDLQKTLTFEVSDTSWAGFQLNWGENAAGAHPSPLV